MRKIYIVSVRGEYITQDNKDRKLKSYEATFRLFDLENARAVIRGKLLMPFLRQNDPGAVFPYSYHVTEVQTETGSSGALDVNDVPIDLQNIGQLTEYCKRNKLPVPVEQYSDLDRCREHVILAKENPVAFKQVFARYKDEMTEDQELATLNQNFQNIGRAGISDIEVDAETGKVISKPSGKSKPKTKQNADLSMLK